MSQPELLVAAAAPWWEVALTLGAFVGVIAAVITAQIWSQRRRRRGEEATASAAEGAEGMLMHPDLS